ncbi:threonine-phosphate decarboxylase CobD [Albidovulum sediminis]|uniref:threonine-phosphate decarboxylase n=1 Tax=Albidovulum sediminis TaxID=3066345 RepID=A0ABT2NMN1_9RHOB|nr:threonine-phosphate decarboxylase CobD [Defluviimonas sediminis]MCT8330188.1 threonine-phosphate decarboxylase CobD [Defluviimonas sediminis]
MRDHGGNLDHAVATFGGRRDDWIDLSTGINRVPYPLPPLPRGAWTDLPTRDALDRLADAARQAYAAPAAILPVAGAQAAIQMIPRLSPPGLARVLAPTYNEHAAALRAAGWKVEEVGSAAALAGADLAVIVNPNNPDGRMVAPDHLLALAGQVKRLVVDESFADPYPELSVAPHADRQGLIVLRSFGKFYGLAGLRLGFILGDGSEIAALAEMAGPWPVSGAAIAVGCTALRDRPWAARTAARLSAEVLRLDALAEGAGWRCEGGTALFRLYETGDAIRAQALLARSRIWSRAFPYRAGWLRLGLPGSHGEWSALEDALAHGGA